METITTEEKPRRKRGPVPGPETVAVTVRLEPDLAEWGKNRLGGLSELVRRLLREEEENATHWVCQECGKPIENGAGYVDVINTNSKLGKIGGDPRYASPDPDIQVPPDENKEKSNPALNFISAEELVKRGAAPQNIGFRVTHTKCGPDTGYNIDLKRARTLAEWCSWVLHVSGKTWMGKEDTRRMLAFWWEHKGEREPDA